MPLVKCPECARQVSTKARSCPNCGYPLLAETKKPTFTEDLGNVKSVGVWVAIGVSAAGLGIPTLLAKLISPGSFGAAETQTLWTIFALTAPLTGAIGIYSAFLFNKTFREVADHYVVHVLILVGAFLVTIPISNLLAPQNPIKLADLKNNIGFWTTPVYILTTYFKAYGAWNFVCSLAVGIFLGWTWEKLFAHARKRVFRQSQT